MIKPNQPPQLEDIEVTAHARTAAQTKLSDGANDNRVDNKKPDAEIADAKAGAPPAPRKASFNTSSGVKLPNDYNPSNTPSLDYEEDLNAPGAFPFTRGIRSDMYRGRLWTMRQYAGYATAEESNARYKYLLAHGTAGLSVAFDLPTQIGLDSDDELANGEVGKVGVCIDSIEDMEQLFDGIPLADVSTSMTINATASTLLCLYIAVAKRQGTASERLNGTIQNDILKEYIARGTYIYPPAPSMRLITDTFAYCRHKVPKWNTISISGYHIREAGATAAQELAFTLADGIAYVEAALSAGLAVDDFAPRLSFFFNAHNNLLEEIAKFRAARRLWARIMRERFKAQNPKSLMLRFHTQTAGSTLTAQQPDTNTVRTTIQALAAIFGGTQSLHTNSFDEALGLPTEHAARLALRTQQVVAYVSGITDTVDPLAGSFAIEALTDELETRALDYIKRIDEMGGMLPAIELGFVQREIQEAAYEFQQAVERKTQIVVGVNQFQLESEPQVPVLRVDPAIEQNQIARLQAMRARRDNVETDAALKRLTEAAQGTENLLPHILTCVEAYATVGEISHTLRRVWGEYREAMTV